MADDRLPALLEEIRERNAKTTYAAPLTHAASADDVPRLLAALDAVLSLHYRVRLYGPAADEEHPDTCPHGAVGEYDQPDRHFEGDDLNWYCEDRPLGDACRTCDGDWPCETYKAARLGLLGEAGNDA